jgi:DNA-binding response OmpR family regulator
VRTLTNQHLPINMFYPKLIRLERDIGMTITIGNEPILILDDEVGYAIEIQGILSQAGFRNCSTFHYCEVAERWLARQSPKVAIIDPRLRDGLCREVVSVLIHRNIPFIVYSSDDVGPVDWLKDGTWLPKPCAPHLLVSAIHLKLADSYSLSTSISLPRSSTASYHPQS